MTRSSLFGDAQERRRRPDAWLALATIFVMGVLQPSALAQEPLCEFSHSPSVLSLLVLVTGIGDLDTDGYADLAFTSPIRDPNNMVIPRIVIHSGRTCGLLGEITGESATSIAGPGDLDADSIPDLLIGNPSSSRVGPAAGTVFVYSGATLTPRCAIDGELEFDGFGGSLAGAGDVDGDGAADFLVGATGSDINGSESGKAYLYSGRTCLRLRVFNGETERSHFGGSVSGAGDVDGDMVPDLLIAAPSDDAGGRDAGKAFLFSGRDGVLLAALQGTANNQGIGRSVSSAGDFNGDGLGDVVIGSHTATQAYVLFGRRTWTGRVLAAHEADVILEGEGGNFGIQVAGLGDFNNDGLDDIAVSAPSYPPGVQGTDRLGRVYVFHGRRAAGYLRLTAQEADVIHTGETPGVPIGDRLARAGDLNGDGSADLLASAIPFLPLVRVPAKVFAFPGEFLNVVDVTTVRLRVLGPHGIS